MTERTRRDTLAGLGVTGVLALAGCTDLAGGTSGSTPEEEPWREHERPEQPTHEMTGEPGELTEHTIDVENYLAEGEWCATRIATPEIAGLTATVEASWGRLVVLFLTPDAFADYVAEERFQWTALIDLADGAVTDDWLLVGEEGTEELVIVIDNTGRISDERFEPAGKTAGTVELVADWDCEWSYKCS